MKPLSPRGHHHVEEHRDVQGGAARAAVFGVSDGLVSNVSLILGVAGAGPSGATVRLAGLAGLIAGAVSMAAGEFISMQAQRELLERELAAERRALADDYSTEVQELAEIYRRRGLKPETAREVADQLMADPDVALEIHAREELGVDPAALGSPFGAAGSSFVAFCAGAVVPLVPWFLAAGAAAVLSSVILGLLTALAVGGILAGFTGRSMLWSALRQALIAAFASAVTFAVGALVGQAGLS
ncbi:MAG: VIT1/CCC1 transporter family protein [Acidimicrobiales bacterium]